MTVSGNGEAKVIKCLGSNKMLYMLISTVILNYLHIILQIEKTKIKYI